MTEGIIRLSFHAVPDLELDYANEEWSKLLKQIRTEHDPHDGLYRSILESVRDALSAETDERVTALIRSEASDLDGLTPDDFNDGG